MIQKKFAFWPISVTYDYERYRFVRIFFRSYWIANGVRFFFEEDAINHAKPIPKISITSLKEELKQLEQNLN